MDSGDQNEVYEFRVTNMAGDNSAYKVDSFQELRVRIAIQAGVMSPCVVFFKRADNTLVEDPDEIAEVFSGDVQPYELNFINNEEAAKKGVTEWSADKWLDAAAAHERYGDERLSDHATALKLADKEFKAKMHEWVKILIHEAHLHKLQDEIPGRVKAAISLGVSAEATDRNRWKTLLHIAAQFGHISVLQMLLDAGASVDAVAANKAMTTPLCEAVMNKHYDAVALLIDSGADVNKTNIMTEAPIHIAADRGVSPEILALLIKARANVNQNTNRSGTPLKIASRRRHVDIMRALMQNGANVNGANNEGSPLYAAVMYNHYDEAAFLIDAGADVNKTGNGGNAPIHRAVDKDHPEMVALLIKAGANVNAADIARGNTPLQIASFRGYVHLIRVLVENGANVNAANNAGGTPLYYALMFKRYDAAALLIDAGADVNKTHDWGGAPIHKAVDKEDHPEMVALLIKAGAKVNVESNRNGFTPLHLASVRGHIDAIRVLMQNGADVNAKHKKGKTPFDVARNKETREALRGQ